MHIRIVSAFAAALGAAGCGSLTTYQSADTLPAGKWQGMAALGAGAFDDKPQQLKTPTASVEVGARRGIAENVDVGAKLYTFGVEASVRWRIARGEWSWALLGAVGGARTNASSKVEPDAVIAQLRLGAVATRRTSGTFAWNFGPLLTSSLFVPAGGGSSTGELLGAFVGLDWRFGARWHLVPELSIHRTIAGDVPVDGTAAMLGSALARDW